MPTPSSGIVPTGTPTIRSTPVGDGGAGTASRIAQAPLAPRDQVAIASRLLYGGETLSRTVAPDTRPYTLGRPDRFWIDDADRQREVTATLRVITPHLYVYVEEGATINQELLDGAAQAFEERIYPTCQQAFGKEWSPGVDGDPHLFVLQVSFDGAPGYFSSQNEVPRRVNRYSNQHEMFVMDLDTSDIGSPVYLGTLAHELQHMIQWYQDPRSEAWVAEGMALMAEQITGYDRSQIAWNFLDDPDVQLTAWSDNPGETLPHYAASYLWFRYFTTQMSSTTVLRSVLDSTVDSVTAIERVLQNAGYQPAVVAPRRFDAFFADWAVANYIDDPTVGDGRYAYEPDLHLDPVWPAEWVRVLPWETTATVQPYGTDYIKVEGVQTGTLRISFEGDYTLPLLNTTPHSGSHFWWSNRGDQADTTLTRSFDLRQTSAATLRYWLWYDIEQDYDYAYVEVSTDGGHSWSAQAGRHTTIGDPNGYSVGHGYTGRSSGGTTPQWVQEEVNLSPFAGREILLRFEMITDDIYNGPGLAIDDLEIPEIGFRDDVESDANWQANGFVWVDNTVPLNFLVQIVTVSPAGVKAVQSLRLDALQQGELILPGYGSSISQVVLVVSAVAPATTEPATYHVRLTLE